jgi:hypothetical protein
MLIIFFIWSVLMLLVIAFIYDDHYTAPADRRSTESPFKDRRYRPLLVIMSSIYLVIILLFMIQLASPRRTTVLFDSVLTFDSYQAMDNHIALQSSMVSHKSTTNTVVQPGVTSPQLHVKVVKISKTFLPMTMIPKYKIQYTKIFRDLN